MNMQYFKKYKYKSAAAILLLIAALFYLGGDSNKATFLTSTVTVGDIKSYIQATGKIEPTRTADIIPEITGVVTHVYVDHNSDVTENQILAQIDPSDFELRLNEAEATLLKANADYELSRNIYNSNKKLYDKDLISKEELNNSKVKYSSTLASKEQAQVNLEIAKTELENTRLISPLKGTVIGRNIVEGQTVTKGQERPPLFTIAGNLDKMIVIASVNEIDIGKLAVGNTCEFVTDAYPNEKFSGQVTQIISEPKTDNNLVTYDVLIEFENKDKKLKPGMTASVEILVASKSNVLLVDRSALRFIPPSQQHIADNSEYSDQDEVVWIKTQGNKLKPIKVKTGAKNDSHVEITEGDVKENDEVVVQAVFGSNKDDSSNQISVPGVKRF